MKGNRSLSDMTLRALPLRFVRGGLVLTFGGWILSTTGWGQTAPSAKPATPQPFYSASITQVDTDDWPKVRVHVSITDQQGNPLSGDQQVSLTLYENGQSVKTDMMSQGRTLASALVLDLSGSMMGERLEKAKEAAINFIRLASTSHQIAVVGFSDADQVRVIGNFKDDRQTLINRIKYLSAGGKTALQDGIGKALELLKPIRGRKAVIALSDGKENASRRFIEDTGHAELLVKAVGSGCTITTIGLANDDNQSYLNSYKMTGGMALTSPSVEELRSKFELAANLLQREKELSYISKNPNRDGIARNLSVDLKVGDVVSPSGGHIIVPEGVLPHVPGDHLPFFALLFLLLYAPGFFGRLGYYWSVRRFRANNIERLKPGSTCLELRDPNVAPTEPRFAVGDLVVKCQTCAHPHYIRSWRNNKCHCMKCHYIHAAKEGGSYCYMKKLPRWSRYFMDSVAARKESPERGRSYLCYCAGDKDGY